MTLRVQHFHGGASCARSEQLNLRASFVAQTKTFFSNAHNEVFRRTRHQA